MQEKMGAFSPRRSGKVSGITDLHPQAFEKTPEAVRARVPSGPILWARRGARAPPGFAKVSLPCNPSRPHVPVLGQITSRQMLHHGFPFSPVLSSVHTRLCHVIFSCLLGADLLSSHLPFTDLLSPPHPSRTGVGVCVFCQTSGKSVGCLGAHCFLWFQGKRTCTPCPYE